MPIGIIKPPDLVGYWPLNGEKPSGVELFDSDKGDYESTTEGWAAQGANDIESSTEKAWTGSKSMKCTYQDTATGAILYFRGSLDLSSDLTIGKKYRVDGGAAVGGAYTVQIRLHGGTTVQFDQAWTSQTMARFQGDFIAEHATDARLYFAMGAGEVIYVDGLSIQELNTPTLVGTDHGTVKGGVTPSPLGGYDFDGVAGSHIDLGPNAGDYTDNFTLMALINISAAVNDRLASRRDDTVAQWDWYLIEAADCITLYDGSASHEGSQNIADGLDHRVATVINGADSFHLVDGKRDGATFSPSITSQSLNTLLGAWGSTGQQSNWPGAIRKFAIYNRALTEAQIHYEMYRGSAFKPVFRGGILWPR